MLSVVRDGVLHFESLSDILQGWAWDGRGPSDHVDEFLLGLADLVSQFLVGETLLLHGSVNGWANWLGFGHCRDSS